MQTIFDFWAGMYRTGRVWMQTGDKMSETLQASNTVIDARTGMMQDAARSPMTGNYAELSRMVPEKVEAFSQGAMAALPAMMAMQNQMLANWQQMMRIGMSGRLPSARQVEAMAKSGAKVMAQGADAGSKALAPVHRTATGNARRLSSAKRRG